MAYYLGLPLRNGEVKMNLDRVRSIHYDSSSKSVFVTYTNGDEECYVEGKEIDNAVQFYRRFPS